jgi:hypothetical protein
MSINGLSWNGNEWGWYDCQTGAVQQRSSRLERFHRWGLGGEGGDVGEVLLALLASP